MKPKLLFAYIKTKTSVEVPSILVKHKTLRSLRKFTYI